MKKEELKKIVKYIVVSVLIVCFATNITFTTVQYINSKVSYDYLFTENYADESYVMYLEEMEHWIGNAENMITETTGASKEGYPVTGAAVEMFKVLNGTYQMEMLIVTALIGVVVGIAAYILKKDYKKIVHYLALYVSLILLLNMAIALITMVVDNVGASTPYISSIGYMEYIDLFQETIIPYTVIYIVTCIIIHLINKKKTEALNKYTK